MSKTAESHEGLVKIRVPILGSARESGFESETLWAEPLGGRRYRVWNLPVFAYNLDMRAVVECEPDPDGGFPLAVRVVEPGDCYAIRLYFRDEASDAQLQEVLNLLGSRRALLEKYNRNLWAVGLRSAEDYEWAGPALQKYVDADILEFESALQPDEPTLGDGRPTSAST